MLKYVPAFVVLVGFYLCEVSSSDVHALVDQDCMTCICEAVSGCNVNKRCSGNVCGPFGITWPYWADAGKPTVQNEHTESATAYSNCASDISCSRVAVQSYMKRFQRDCFGDGQVDCDDFVHIHILGPTGCRGTMREEQNNRYLRCISKLF